MPREQSEAPEGGRRIALASRRRGRGGPPLRVLDQIEGALDGVPWEQRSAACGECVAPVVDIPIGEWKLPADQSRARSWLGLLVTKGLLTRTVEIDGLRAQELLGPGDLLRPWDDDGTSCSVAAGTEWRALERSSVAVLDERFTRAAATWPAVTSSLLAAAIRRSHANSVLLALSRARRADDRLMLLFWHLADRWGKVGPDGVHVPLRITHTVLAELVCLRRPTVSTALAELRGREQVRRLDDGSWFLPRRATDSGVARAA